MPAQQPWLLIVAAPREVRAALDALDPSRPTPESWELVRLERCHLVRSGVGKAAAAGATARCYQPDTHAGVLSIGLAGSLPGSDLQIGDVVLADPSRFGDEGVRLLGYFCPLDRLGFGTDAADTAPDGTTCRALAQLVRRVGPVATVSACSGTDQDARELAERTGAIAEAMEGAACGLAARRINPAARFAEVRVISNRTGAREHQGWDLEGSLQTLSLVLGPVLNALPH